jgi:hypothetical protein
MKYICAVILGSLFLIANHAAYAQAFQFSGTYPINYNVEGYSLGIGDLNGDGILDLAVAEQFGDRAVSAASRYCSEIRMEPFSVSTTSAANRNQWTLFLPISITTATSTS